jgi:hypothetical protein
LHLSLKVIAHYGSMAEYTIGSFKKLYGRVVVEAHRLLKNSIGSDTYFLMTESLEERAGDINSNRLTQQGFSSGQLCEIYGALKNICFTYFDFTVQKGYRQLA